MRIQPIIINLRPLSPWHLLGLNLLCRLPILPDVYPLHFRESFVYFFLIFANSYLYSPQYYEFKATDLQCHLFNFELPCLHPLSALFSKLLFFHNLVFNYMYLSFIWWKIRILNSSVQYFSLLVPLFSKIHLFFTSCGYSPLSYLLLFFVVCFYLKINCSYMHRWSLCLN